MPSEENPAPAILDERVDDRLKEVMLLRGKKLPDELKTRVTVSHEFKKKEKHLGLVHRHGMVTRVNYDSPFKGSILTGDVILMVNGQEVSFDEKSVERKAPEKTAIQQSSTNNSKIKSARKKSASMTPKGRDFKETIRKLLAKTEDVIKIDITVVRLKMRYPAPKVPAITITSGSSSEGAVIYQFKYLKLGLNMQQVDKRVVVNYTTPDSVSHASLNIGEVILAVDGKAVSTLEDVRQRILDGCTTNGFARLLVEFPMSDPQKNTLRNQLATAAKEAERPLYTLSGDVRKYCEAGIEILAKSKEPVPIYRESDNGKELEKKKSTRKANKCKDPTLSFREKTEEHDIPSEWNSKLFVVLPPLKSKETEMATAGPTPPPAKK